MAKRKKKSAGAPAPGKTPTTHAQRRAARKSRKKTTITKVTKETRETRSNPGRRANPPVLDDFTHVLVPGFLAYAGTRILQRIVYSIVQRRWPKLGKHAHALSGVAAAAGVWIIGHRIKALAKYHDGVVLGSGIAAGHGLAVCYLPKKYNWLLADCKPSDVKPANGEQIAAAQQAQLAPADGDEYSYLEAQLDEVERGGSKAARTIPAPRGSTRPIGKAMAMATAGQNDGADLDPDLMDALEPGEDVDSFYTGAFSTN